MKRTLHPVALATLLAAGSTCALADVDFVDIRADGIRINDGRVTVRPVNGRYGQLVNPETPYHVEMKAGCKGLNQRLKTTFVAFGNAAMNGSVVEANPGMITTTVSNRGNDEIPYTPAQLTIPTASLQGAVNPVNVCNAWLDQRLAQGASLQQVLAKDHTIVKPVTLSAVASCGTNNGTPDYRTDTMQHQLAIVCQAGSVGGAGGIQAQVPQPPQPPQAPGGFTKNLQVTGVELKAMPATVTGTCPAKVRFQGEVSADAAGTVHYQVRFPGNANTPEQAWGGQLNFDKAGTRPTPMIEFNAASGYPVGVAVMEVVNPGNTKANANFKVQCVNAPGPGSVQMGPLGPTPPQQRQVQQAGPNEPPKPALNLQAVPATPKPPGSIQATPLDPKPAPARNLQSQ